MTLDKKSLKQCFVFLTGPAGDGGLHLEGGRVPGAAGGGLWAGQLRRAALQVVTMLTLFGPQVVRLCQINFFSNL